VSVKPTDKGKWIVEIDRKGIPRIRKSFDAKDDAEIFEREYLANHLGRQQLAADPRTLSELVKLWYKYHGVNLSDGVRRQDKLLAMATELKNPRACLLSAEQFVEYRYNKLQGEWCSKTFNNNHGYLSALYNKLHKLKVIDYDNPIADVDFINIQERQLSYLSKEQISTLMEVIKSGSDNKSTWYVTQLCLRTGARWGEVEQLRFKQLHNNCVTYEFTKSKRTRTIPISSDFYENLIRFAGYKNPDDRVFTNCIGAFRRAIKRADIKLQKGQNTHILRHSFASYQAKPCCLIKVNFALKNN